MDLIERQKAIDELISEPPELNYGFWYAEKIKALPSAQPEIVRCKDCNNYDTDWTPETFPDRHYCFVMDGMMPKDGFCNYAERRTDGSD